MRAHIPAHLGLGLSGLSSFGEDPAGELVCAVAQQRPHLSHRRRITST